MVSLRSEFSAVIGSGLPPPAEMRCSGLWVSGANRMTSSRFQVPPRPSLASQMVMAAPPLRSIFFSLPSAKNPIWRLSGDQNGNAAPSVLCPY